MRELHVACAADENYVCHSATMLHSTITRGGLRIVAHYLHGPTFPVSAVRGLEEMCHQHGACILFHEIPPDHIAGLPIESLFGVAMWYRIFLADILPDVERILYLDADTIVVDSLDELSQMDLTGAYMAAVRNVLLKEHRHRPRQLGLPASHYFNSGVLLLNLNLWRRDAITQKLLDRVRSAPHGLDWPDQDALNLTVGSRTLPLHPRWNCMNSMILYPRLARRVFGRRVIADAVRNPAIRHFEGPASSKPWHAAHDESGQALYRQHRMATPWPEYTLEKDSRVNPIESGRKSDGPPHPARSDGIA